MKEQINFITLNNRKLFIHFHIPLEPNHKFILFLNPLFDEKKRVQNFQAQTARALCLLNYHIVRFDYYGTGDSEGDTCEFDFENTLKDLDNIVIYLKQNFQAQEIILMGIRAGGDLAILYAKNNKLINHLLLIEPVVNGNRYLLELRTKRKAFYSLNRMINASDKVEISSEVYEDFQGYLLSKNDLSFLEILKSDELLMENKHIGIFKTDSLFNKKTTNSLIANLKTQSNHIELFQIKAPEFWSSLEYVDTSIITKSVLDYLKI